MESNFDEIISTLDKKQESRDLLKILVKIRKEVEWPKHKDNVTKLRIRGYLKHLVRILQMPQKPIIDVSLSILGNCIMDRDSAREAIGTYNILSPLVHLLKRYPKEDCVLGRIFRILGNMCTQRDQWANIIIDRTPQFVTHTVDLIKAISKVNVLEEDNYSEATVVMALRALRLLLNSKTVIPLVKTFGVLKIVGSYFIKLTMEWQETKKNENLLHTIIRLFHEYSRFKYYASIHELRNTERGDTFLFLCNVLLLYPKRIVRIIMNFMKICLLKSELPIPEICDKFINEVTKEDLNIEEFKEEYMGYIQCLCYLLSHPANRTAERCGRCLPLFVRVLEAFEDPSDAELESCILMVTTLNSCRFDGELVRDQMRCKVIQTLVDKLKWLRGAEKGSPAVTVKHTVPKTRGNALKRRKWNAWHEEKRPCRCALETDEDLYAKRRSTSSCERRPCPTRYVSPSNSDEEYVDVDRSPSPSSSSESDLPVSPFGSPNPAAMDDSDTDSDNYSPVCSEADSEEFSPTYQENEQDAEQDEPLDGMVVDVLAEAEQSPREELITENLKGALIVEIAKLINAYARVQPPLPELASEDLFIELVNCSEHFVNNPSCRISTVSILCKIIRSPVYLIPLMRTTVIEKIYSMMQYRHNPLCVRCEEDQYLGKRVMRNFTEIAEGGMGKGDIAHALLRGSNEVKEQVVLAIPYIVVDKSLLVNFFLHCGGLDILMYLTEDRSPYKDRAIKVLCLLASKRLAIANPCYVPLTNVFGLKLMHLEKPYKCGLTEERTVTFKLDDGSYVRADRNLLTEKSEYFASLLSGHFKESSEDEVALHNVENDTLRCVLHLLKHTGRIERLVCRRTIHTLLDSIVLADRYLLPELCTSLTNCIEKHRMTPKTVAAIYRWSHESGLNMLRVESVAFALVQRVADDARRAMFDELFRLGYADELRADIRALLGRYLNSLSRREVYFSD